MKLLLDTHIAVWALTAVEELAERDRQLIGDPANRIFVSVINVWEIAVKRPLKGWDAPLISAEEAITSFAAAGYTMLDVKPTHAAAVETLPLFHGDPFDRLLLAQALTEPLNLLTHDKMLTRYSDTVLCFRN